MYGKYRIDALGKSNMAGGIAATIGNAHAAEEINIAHCILAGNRVIPTVGSPYEEGYFHRFSSVFSKPGIQPDRGGEL